MMRGSLFVFFRDYSSLGSLFYVFLQIFYIFYQIIDTDVRRKSYLCSVIENMFY